ncbi:MAG: NAD(P)H-dependent oxidoreductase [Thermodesulfobacteriota bacterium]
MKVMAVNSSARVGGESKTELMLNRLVAGMRAAGAEVEVVNLRHKKINFCLGCFTCWTKTPGVCIHKDDFTKEIYPKWRESDLVVYATPLYHFTVNAAMKAFIERTLPFLEPFLVRQPDGTTSHPQRFPHPKVVLLSVAGFPEPSVFDQLSAWANFVFGRHGYLQAEIYRPGAEMLKQPFFREEADDALAAAEQAGRELVETGRVAEETLARIGQPLGDPDIMARMANIFWKTCLAKGVSPKEFAAQGLTPRPDDHESFLLLMSVAFNRQAAQGLEAVMQFDFAGQAPGSCHLKINREGLATALGPHPAPSLTVTVPFEVWMDVITGQVSGEQVFMEQKATAAGDFNLLLKMGALFSGPK